MPLGIKLSLTTLASSALLVRVLLLLVPSSAALGGVAAPRPRPGSLVALLVTTRVGPAVLTTRVPPSW